MVTKSTTLNYQGLTVHWAKNLSTTTETCYLTTLDDTLPEVVTETEINGSKANITKNSTIPKQPTQPNSHLPTSSNSSLPHRKSCTDEHTLQSANHQSSDLPAADQQRVEHTHPSQNGPIAHWTEKKQETMQETLHNQGTNRQQSGATKQWDPLALNQTTYKPLIQRKHNTTHTGHNGTNKQQS